MPNQDCVLTRQSRSSWLAVVSDGLGSRSLSHLGSRAACQSVLMATRQCSFYASDKVLIHCIYQNWLRLLHHTSPNEAAATCLMAWGLASGESRFLQLGDGEVVLHAQSVGKLKHNDESGFSNETTGLGISRKYSDWQSQQAVLTQFGQGVVLMTDGISDDIDNLNAFSASVITSLKDKGARYGKRWMTRELEAWPTPRHTDDKSIAVVYRN